VADLGCGPASQLVHIASINRDIQFTGFDLSEEMMDQGNGLIAKQGLTNARVQNGDITRLPDVADGSFDAVITTMTLHQFPESTDVEHCFATINRILKPGGAVYIVDFGRLKYLSSMQKFVSLDAANQLPVFNDDYENSLKAAFLKSELESAARHNLPSTIDIYQTFALPMLVVIKTPDKPLPKAVHKALMAKRLELSRRYRAELDDIRLFFKLGGMKNDPFSSRVALQGA
jgi:SAM-dependent methyltransferase